MPEEHLELLGVLLRLTCTGRRVRHCHDHGAAPLAAGQQSHVINEQLVEAADIFAKQIKAA
jgi:hypothetical protein